MAKKLACWFGRHKWEKRVDQGESYETCAECGKTPRGRGKPPMSGTDLNWMQGQSGP